MANTASTAQKGKTWFITGASSGFGRLLAEHLLDMGASVIATARRVEDISDLTATRPGSYVIPLDVTSADSIAHAVAQGLAYTGGVDVLVNNAGYGVCGALEEVQQDEYMPMFETNVFGLVNVTKAFLPHFRERRSGAIINLSSIGGLIGSPGWGFYNATKFAVEGLSEALHAEMAPLGVKVMVVEPGPFRTDFLGRSGQEAGLRIPDYETTVGKTREYFKTQAGKQPGDPQRAVEAMVEAISSPEPPKHLLLGKIALQRYRNHLKEWGESLDKWQDLTNGADFPESEDSLTVPAYGDAKR
jgi:NAD(P)-dependent dehydrogenase (short-subunit alcohol dehydrogenase family)